MEIRTLDREYLGQYRDELAKIEFEKMRRAFLEDAKTESAFSIRNSGKITYPQSKEIRDFDDCHL